MNKISIYILTVSINLIPLLTVKAQVPVTDSASIQQTAKEYIQTASRWVDQVKQYQNIYANAQSQLASLTNVTDIKDALLSADKTIGSLSQLDSLISDPQAIIQNGFSALPSSLQSIYKEFGLDKNCVDKSTTQEKNTCEGTIALMALQQQRNLKTLQILKQRTQNISNIAAKMGSAQTLKQSTDYANELNVELGLLQVDKQSFEMQASQQALQEKLLAQQEWQNKLDNMTNNLDKLGIKPKTKYDFTK